LGLNDITDGDTHRAFEIEIQCLVLRHQDVLCVGEVLRFGSATKGPENDTFSTAEKLYAPPPSVTIEAVRPWPLSKATVAPETGTPPTTLTRPDRRSNRAALGSRVGASGLELGVDDEPPQALTSSTALAHPTSFIALPIDAGRLECAPRGRYDACSRPFGRRLFQLGVLDPISNLLGNRVRERAGGAGRLGVEIGPYSVVALQDPLAGAVGNAKLNIAGLATRP
jgi:hypothetical protein